VTGSLPAVRGRSPRAGEATGPVCEVKMTMNAERDLDLLVEDDHRSVERLFSMFESGDGDRRATAEQLVRELSVHATAEEQVVYPELSKHVADGAILADEARAEHQRMKELLVEIDRGDDDGRLRELVTELKREVQHHVREEEGDLLPRLRAAVGPARFRELGEWFQSAKDKAPTRPHPHAPSTRPGNVVAGAAARLVDRVRDARDGR
jgi:hemerythrin superfamily protein